MYKKFDLITIGDSTVDTFIKIHDATVECDINHQECKICIKYGDKIPVDSIDHGVAGNAANVAVGTSKLGLKSAIYTNLGDDQQGKLVLGALKKNGVTDDYVETHRNQSSNLSVVLTFRGERTIFVYHQPWHYKLPNLEDAWWVYLTSVAETFSDSNLMNEIVHYVDKSRAKLGFGPGTYQLAADIKRYPKVLERCEFLIVNLEEAKKILGIKTTEVIEPKELLSRLLFLGPKIIVITNGSEGSYATDGKRNLKAGIFPTEIVEKTGAGDAYASGLISGLFWGLPLEEAMIWGTINASHVILEVGPQNGLLTKEELERHRKTVKELLATTF